MDNNNSVAADKKQKNKLLEEMRKKADSLGVPLLEKVPELIKKDAIAVIKRDSAKRYEMFAFEKKGNLVKVAIVDPQNIEALNVLRFISEKDDLNIEIYLVSKKVFDEVIEKYDIAEEAVDDVMESLKSESEKRKEKSSKIKKIESLTDNVLQDAPVSKLVRVIIKHAVDGGASDIHIEPFDDNYRVRFRVDGVLHSSLMLPKEVGIAVISRVKILATLKIDEKRKPQDGRFSTQDSDEIAEEEIDFRVSTFPVVDGEKVVMRVLDKENAAIDFEKLGLMGRNGNILNEAMKETNGIILMTGPTGSGKSTTLYALLQIINKEDRNIVTLEDPVEYSIKGINQSQIKPEIDYTFSNGLRSILRQDPNVIMVGEIRDGETAELAIHAALTGHLVLSTLHTNSAIGALPRLIDMKIEPFLLTSSLRIVAAQRLVRRVCKYCSKEIKLPDSVEERVKNKIKDISPEEMEKYNVDISKGVKFFEGEGCDECGKTGFKGRVAVYECVEVNKDIQEIILSGGSENKIIELAEKQGYLTMKQDGILKVLSGLTTLSEVERVTEGSMSVGGDVGDDKG